MLISRLEIKKLAARVCADFKIRVPHISFGLRDYMFVDGFGEIIAFANLQSWRICLYRYGMDKRTVLHELAHLLTDGWHSKCFEVMERYLIRNY